ncbi:MAG TPA: bifunctional diaminohydroxyphosphoribosylaminopyrimidine deaminase/5-amino-6-(5-phosphoribosylamino)uracil reductase RibD [Tepidisphaeraceae bacterium]|nr:bifunctional diaminohydroxyphosphoribosylaminopyrimidine deaminase/5-amino-6-(5-phosphoribosylamino)uracil reductase RibD [Tepidisphaeraceae bacterium]
MANRLEQIDESFMRSALALAAKGRGAVEPNPMVGCVIVRNDRLIGEGYHRKFGGPHAEANALEACTESPAGATAYVTLEPCCHPNKKTPPCVPRLIEAKLARVVVGCVDPNPAVSGKGIEELRQAGIEVTAPELEAECKQLSTPFFKRVLHGLPYVTLKWAQSSNGKVGGPAGKRVWISNDASRCLVHELRARSDAILVGINTVLGDDPLLTARCVETARPLIRAVLDRRLRIPLTSRLVKTAREHRTIVYCAEGKVDSATALELREHHVTVVGLSVAGDKLDLTEMLRHLAAQDVTHLLVEPGPILAASFLDLGLADRVWVIRSPNAIDGPDAPPAPQVPYPPTASVWLDGDQLTEYLNPQSPVFFAEQPSVDFPSDQSAKREGEAPAEAKSFVAGTMVQAGKPAPQQTAARREPRPPAR